MSEQANRTYLKLLREVIADGNLVHTRNSEVYSHFNLPNVTFTELPLVTLRKTAAMKAILEMEWFLSGDPKCPESLLDWWEGQLDKDKCLLDGYSAQFKGFSMTDGDYFDQVEFMLCALKTNPNSRRLVMTVWNPGEMAHITETNENPNTPTCCHSIVVQFFVREGTLHMKTYQRSADMLLGVPHNWVQSWAMLMYFAGQSGLKVGSMTWMWGDAHVYKEDSHVKTVSELFLADKTANGSCEVRLEYTPTSTDFLATDFKIVGEIPQPVVTTRPKLL